MKVLNNYYNIKKEILTRNIKIKDSVEYTMKDNNKKILILIKKLNFLLYLWRI